MTKQSVRAKSTSRLNATLAGSALIAMCIGLAAVIAEPAYALDTKPKPSACPKGQKKDKKTNACVPAAHGDFDDETLLEAGRELAHDGRFEDAITVLMRVRQRDDPRVLNLLGYSHRKAGRFDVGMTYYRAALKTDPDFILARSYMGQALALDGDIKGARRQLAEIKARGGFATPAYEALKVAILDNAKAY